MRTYDVHYADLSISCMPASRIVRCLLLCRLAPSQSALTITSNSSYPQHCKQNDEVTVSITTSEPLLGNTASITVFGNAATVTNPTGTTFEGKYTLSGSYTNGVVPFTVVIEDPAGNTASFTEAAVTTQLNYGRCCFTGQRAYVSC